MQLLSICDVKHGAWWRIFRWYLFIFIGFKWRYKWFGKGGRREIVLKCKWGWRCKYWYFNILKNIFPIIKYKVRLFMMRMMEVIKYWRLGRIWRLLVKNILTLEYQILFMYFYYFYLRIFSLRHFQNMCTSILIL